MVVMEVGGSGGSSVAGGEAPGLVADLSYMRLAGSGGSSLFDTAPLQETGSGSGKKYNTGLSQSCSRPGRAARLNTQTPTQVQWTHDCPYYHC